MIDTIYEVKFVVEPIQQVGMASLLNFSVELFPKKSKPGQRCTSHGKVLFSWPWKNGIKSFTHKFENGLKFLNNLGKWNKCLYLRRCRSEICSFKLVWRIVVRHNVQSRANIANSIGQKLNKNGLMLQWSIGVCRLMWEGWKMLLFGTSCYDIRTEGNNVAKVEGMCACRFTIVEEK